MTPLLGILLALAAAVVWGGGDFSGGLATRRNHQFQVLALSAVSGIIVLVVLALLKGESIPSMRGTIFAVLAGAAAALGLASLYRGLSLGNAATVAPTAAVIGAIIPVGFTALAEGLPDAAQSTGMILGLLGIWLVSRTSFSGNEKSQQGFALACLAGLGFGAFFTLIAQVEPGLVFTPLILARGVTLLVALLLLRIGHMPPGRLAANPTALLAGALDVTGDAFYLLAREYTRLDIATVLGSLYPATTVLLSFFILRERITRTQLLGLVLCLAAVSLIAV